MNISGTKPAIIAGILLSPPAFSQPNILLIGTDGASARYINNGINQTKPESSIADSSTEARPLPTYQSMINDKHGALTLDITSTTNQKGERNTISGANWTSLLTGTPFDVHGIIDNTVNRVVRNGETVSEFANYNGTPLLTEELKSRGYKTKMMAEWGSLNPTYGRFFDESETVPLVWRDTAQDGSLGLHTAVSDNNYPVGNALSTTDANFVFVHIDSVDDDGHTYGWDSAEYAKGIKQLDDKASLILKGLMNRPNINNEEWIIGITPDHGGVDYGHGQNGNPLVYNTYFVALHWNKGAWQVVTLKKDSNATISDVLPRLIAQESIVNTDINIHVDKDKTLADISPIVQKDSWVRNIRSDHALIKSGEGELILNDNTRLNRLEQREGSMVLNAIHIIDNIDIKGGSLIVAGSVDAKEIDNQARLINNGFITANLALKEGSLMSGNGIVNGNIDIHSGATIAPGNSIGKQTVNGDVTFYEGANYDVEVARDGRSDQLVSTGAVHINGGRVNVKLEPSSPNMLIEKGAPSLLQQYPILTAERGIDGQFGAIATEPDYLFLGASLSQLPNQLVLTIGRNDTTFTSVAKTQNQRAVATAAEALGAGHPVYESLLTLENADLARQAFSQLNGQIHADIASAQINDSHYVRDAVNSRLRQAAGLSAAPEIKADSENGLWGQFIGGWDHTTGNSNATGYQATTRGVLLGADTEIADDWRLGMATGFTRTSLDGGYGSRASSDNYHLALYGGKQFGDLALRTGASYSRHRIDTSRTVNYASQSDQGNAKYSANTQQVFIESGYKIENNVTNLEPFVNLAYINYQNKGMQEKGGFAALRSQSQHTETTLSTVGLRTDNRWQITPNTAVALQTELGWQHDYGNTGRDTALMFKDSNPSFTVNTLPIERNAAVLKTQASIAAGENWVFAVGYSGQLSRNHQNNSVNAGLSWNF